MAMTAVYGNPGCGCVAASNQECASLLFSQALTAAEYVMLTRSTRLPRALPLDRCSVRDGVPLPRFKSFTARIQLAARLASWRDKRLFEQPGSASTHIDNKQAHAESYC